MERSLAEVCVLSGEGLQLGGEAVVARLMADVLEALKYLHSRGVVHRDVRSDNLLFSNDGRLLLADFFHAVQLSPERPTRKEVVGVWYWMAPELRAGQPYNTAVDIYSLGATLWELLEGVPPHSEIEDVDFLRTICHLPPLSQPLRWSEQLRSFLALCAEEPSRRPSAVALLDHPFIRRACPRSEVVALLNRARVLEDELHRQEAGATI
ncbi:kinase-like protein [Dacryopinax primogenitus]|uniref:Kinase-like protein n=1 Tax=Dacryopinax primogenitus (strain DJM 731) TaxID=1858805 RepID=M5FVD0_DACPD|nr:kinase-like protein [Dacryopinax primogenitus]EJU00229.1 kinase-like protein [Dacryopinax primogenitus]